MNTINAVADRLIADGQVDNRPDAVLAAILLLATVDRAPANSRDPRVPGDRSAQRH